MQKWCGSYSSLRGPPNPADLFLTDENLAIRFLKMCLKATYVSLKIPEDVVVRLVYLDYSTNDYKNHFVSAQSKLSMLIVLQVAREIASPERTIPCQLIWYTVKIRPCLLVPVGSTSYFDENFSDTLCNHCHI